MVAPAGAGCVEDYDTDTSVIGIFGRSLRLLTRCADKEEEDYSIEEVGHRNRLDRKSVV